MGPIPVGLGAAVDLFCAAKAAEGSPPRTVEWYRMILIRAGRRFGEPRPVDAISAAELRAWLQFALAVDDVGAGVANFSHLVELRPDSSRSRPASSAG